MRSLQLAARLRVSEKSAGELQNLVGAAQLLVLVLQDLDALALIGSDARALAAVNLGAPDPAEQGGRCAADLGRNRAHCRPQGTVIAAHLLLPAVQHVRALRERISFGLP